MSYCHFRRRSAFTLVEVVAGLVLMATVLVSSLLAFSSHRRQARTAEMKLAAVAFADDLLNEFSSLDDGIPDSGRGLVAGRNWIWRTRVVGIARPADVRLKVIRLEISEVAPGGSVRRLAAVEVLEPVEQ